MITSISFEIISQKYFTIIHVVLFDAENNQEREIAKIQNISVFLRSYFKFTLQRISYPLLEQSILSTIGETMNTHGHIKIIENSHVLPAVHRNIFHQQ